jgi:surface protein
MAQIDLFKIKLNGDSSGNGGGGECPPPSVLSSVTYTENGTYTPTAGVDGYNRVTVDVAIPQFELEQKSVTITENGTQTITPTTGYDGLSEVSVTVNVATSGGSTSDGFDFSVLGYDTTLNNSCNYIIQADIDYSKTLFDAWDPATTSAIGMFQDNIKLVYCPLLNTSNITNMQSMFFGCESLTTIPAINTSNVTNMGRMFFGCSSLQYIPLLNTSNVTNMQYMFQKCSLLQSIPLLNTSNVTTMYYMFQNCSLLQSIPLLDTSNVTDMGGMFYECSALTSIPQLNISNVTNMQYMFYSCSSLQSLPLLDFGKVTNITRFFGGLNITTLTDLGGFKNLKIDWNDNYGLYRLPNLTYESVINILNNLYDFRGNGDTTTTRTFALNANSKALLSDADIAIATNKGWIIS